MLFKKIRLIILGILPLFLFGCAQTNLSETLSATAKAFEIKVEPDYYINENDTSIKKDIRFWGENVLLYETTTVKDETPYTNLFLQNLDTGIIKNLEKESKEFMITEATQLDKSHIIYIKRFSEHIDEERFSNQIICLNLQTLEEILLKEEITNHPVNDLKRLDNSKFIRFTPNITESGYQYIFTIFDLLSKKEITIDFFSYNDEEFSGTIASAFTTDDKNIYIYINNYKNAYTPPIQNIYVFDHNGIFQYKYNIDINSALDLQNYFNGNISNDTIIDMSKHNNYFLLKSQHCRYILLKENNGSLVTVETPTALLAPFQYRLISNYSNDVNNIFFYDLTTKLLAFNVKTEKFYEINLEFPKNKKDYEIMTAYIDTKGTMIFQTSDWRKNDPNRSYGYFIIENIFKLK